MPAQKSVKAVQSPSKSDKKAKPVPASKPPVAKSKAQLLKESADALLATSATAKKKPGPPPQAAAAAAAPSASTSSTGAHRSTDFMPQPPWIVLNAVQLGVLVAL